MKYFFGVVHNNEKTRLSYLNRKFELFKKYLPLEFQFYGIQETYSLKYWQIFVRLFFRIIETARTQSGGKAILFDAVYSDIKFGTKILLRGGGEYFAYRRRSNIEWEITKKHLKLVKLFQESDSEFLVIFESDALIPSQKNFVRCVQFAERELLNFQQFGEMGKLKNGKSVIPRLWVRLSTGFNIETLNIDQYLFAKKVEKGLIINFFSKPSTNTSCCYMMNRLMANSILEIFSKPYIAFSMPPIDFFYNQVLRKIAMMEEVVCMDFEVPPVIHGSRDGKHNSWQNERESRF